MLEKNAHTDKKRFIFTPNTYRIEEFLPTSTHSPKDH